MVGFFFAFSSKCKLRRAIARAAALGRVLKQEGFTDKVSPLGVRLFALDVPGSARHSKHKHTQEFSTSSSGIGSASNATPCGELSAGGGGGSNSKARPVRHAKVNAASSLEDQHAAASMANAKRTQGGAADALVEHADEIRPGLWVGGEVWHRGS